MSWIVEFYRSSIGRKMAMAVSGLVLFGFVLMHMVGNLKVYLGAEAFNHYAEGLRTMGAPIFGHGQLLWIARIVLLLAVLVHIHAAWRTSRISHAARPTNYQRRRSVQQTYAERTMRWGGIIVLLFILYHLAHFTFGPSWAHPDFIQGDPYHNFVVGFSVWWVSAFYIVAQLCLGMHLYHGLWSLFQSLGISPKGADWRRSFAGLFASLVVLGNISFPLAVLAGVVS
jgi:succinate dehydrogenase / fumarate reductase cytochrome b subunit